VWEKLEVSEIKNTEIMLQKVDCSKGEGCKEGGIMEFPTILFTFVVDNQIVKKARHISPWRALDDLLVFVEVESGITLTGHLDFQTKATKFAAHHLFGVVDSMLTLSQGLIEGLGSDRNATIDRDDPRVVATVVGLAFLVWIAAVVLSYVCCIRTPTKNQKKTEQGGELKQKNLRDSAEQKKMN
jgi:hypothetical protein